MIHLWLRIKISLSISEVKCQEREKNFRRIRYLRAFLFWFNLAHFVECLTLIVAWQKFSDLVSFYAIFMMLGPWFSWARKKKDGGSDTEYDMVCVVIVCFCYGMCVVSRHSFFPLESELRKWVIQLFSMFGQELPMDRKSYCNGWMGGYQSRKNHRLQKIDWSPNGC